MAKFELLLPKMGESIMEATILNWVKNVGDTIEAEETIAEIATYKVDSEVPSPVGGTITKIFFKENDTVPIGEVIAWIETGAAVTTDDTPSAAAESTETASSEDHVPVRERAAEPTPSFENSNRFYSPLVKNIAKKEQVSIQELDMIPGTGMQERVTKKDILNYLKDRATAPSSQTHTPAPAQQQKPAAAAVVHNGNHDIIEMDRMRKLISEHMVMSKHVSPHVTSFVEADVTNIWNWRNKIKDEFRPVALMGLNAGENLFVAADGKWQSSYVPAIIRRYP